MEKRSRWIDSSSASKKSRRLGGADDADDGVQLVHVAVGGHPRVILRHPAAAEERRSRPRRPSWCRSSSAGPLHLRGGHDHVARRAGRFPRSRCHRARRPAPSTDCRAEPKSLIGWSRRQKIAAPRPRRRERAGRGGTRAGGAEDGLLPRARAVPGHDGGRQQRVAPRGDPALPERDGVAHLSSAERKAMTSAASTSARVLISIRASAGSRSTSDGKSAPSTESMALPVRATSSSVRCSAAVAAPARAGRNRLHCRSAAGVGPGQRAQHRASQRRTPGAGSSVHDDLDLGAAPATARCLAAGWRGARLRSDRAASRPSPASILARARSSAAAGAAERDDALARERPPGLVRLEQVGPVAPHQSGHESRCRSRADAPPGWCPRPRSFPPGTGESTRTSLATLIESSGAGGRSRSSSPRKRPAPRHPLRPSERSSERRAERAARRTRPGAWAAMCRVRAKRKVADFGMQPA